MPFLAKLPQPHHHTPISFAHIHPPPPRAMLAPQESVRAARKHHDVKSLPPQYLSPDAMVFLNIPMDAETPTMRLLRPQARIVCRTSLGSVWLSLRFRSAVLWLLCAIEPAVWRQACASCLLR